MPPFPWLRKVLDLRENLKMVENRFFQETRDVYGFPFKMCRACNWNK